MRLTGLAVVVCVVALGGVALAAPTAFNDVSNGNWDTTAPDPWGAGGDYPGKDYLPGPPEVPDPDTVTIDSNVVTTNIDIRPEVVTTVQAGGTFLLPAGLTQNAPVTLDGGRLQLTGWGTASHMAGTVTVLQGSEVYTTGHGNPMAAQTSYLDGDIVDGATTGQLHFRGAHTTRIPLSGNNGGFSGGMLVDTPSYVGLSSNGAAGTGALIVNTQVRVNTHQTGTVATPSSVTVNSGGTLYVNNRYNGIDVTVTNWNITMAANTMLQFGNGEGTTGKLDGTGSLILNGDMTMRVLQDGRWSATGVIAVPVSGAANVLVPFANPDDSQQGQDTTRLTFAADNSAFTGDIRTDVLAFPLDPMTNVVRGAAANALGSNNSIVIAGGSELEITDPDALNGTNVLYLLAGSKALLDLDTDIVVEALHIGGKWSDLLGEVECEDGTWMGIKTYGQGDNAELDEYVQFDGFTIEVLTNPGIIPEPAGLGLIGLALLGLKKKRS